MNKLIALFFVLLFSTISIGIGKNTDTTKRSIDNLQSQINSLKDKTEEIKNGQLNYAIEKDLLKETYSANYDKINSLIAIILGVGAILTFFGIRDINSIKKELRLSWRRCEV